MVIRVRLQSGPIDTAAELSSAGSLEDGAVLGFIGTVRNHSGGKKVRGLYYEAYDSMAQREIERIAGEASKRWSLTNCIVVHRTGGVEPGQASILIAVSSHHRNEGFEALRFIIDSIKKTVPIWKKELYADGSAWISEHP